MLHNRWVKSLAPGAAAVILLAAAAPASARGDEWYEINGKALEHFEFDGVTLPTSIDDLKHQYPHAEQDHERVDETIGLACFVVRDLQSADLGRFYFCDGRLYQFEAVYEQPRIEKLGGVRAIVQELVDTWGPADHIGESRWTWQRPMYSRRADFYSWPQRSQLVITDMSWMPIVNQRLVKSEKKDPANIGF